MKIMKELVIFSALILTATTTMAAHTMKPSKNWICTTNASSSTLKADKAADDNMAKNKKYPASAFSYALSHCRDCTKITCEAQK